MFKVVTLTLAAAVATNGTFVVGYPDGHDRGHFENAVGHYFSALGGTFTQPDDFTVVFGDTSATVTYKGATTLPQGTPVYFQFEKAGDPEGGAVDRRGVIGKYEADPQFVDIPGVVGLKTLLIEFGAPDASTDVDAVIEAYTGDGTDIAIDGALADSNGVVTFDWPRNLVVDSGGADTAVLTFTGTDIYGQTMVESITLNGTTAVAGKKAFKTVTGVTSSAAIANGAFVGFGDVLGLPVHLPSGAYVISELEDGAAASSGTLVAGLAVNTPSTATTADVRGTYDPNSAADGAKSFALLVALPDPDFLGNPQYAG